MVLTHRLSRAKSRTRVWGGALVFASAVGALGSGCRDDDTVARLADKQGEVRTQVEGEAPWEQGEVGQAFREGGAVDTGAGASARVELVPEGALRLGEHSRVRFGEEDRRVGLEIGGAEIEAGDEGLTVHSEVGEAEIDPASRVEVELSDGQLRFAVRVGGATVERVGEDPEELDEGESLTIEAGEDDDGDDEGAAREREQDEGDDDEPGEPDHSEVRVDVTGGGARIRDVDGAWERLEAGSRNVPVGAEITLDTGTAIELTRGEGSARIDGEASLRVGDEDGEIARATRGSGTLSADGGRVYLEVPGGAIVARGDQGAARADVGIDESGDTAAQAARGRVDVVGEVDRVSLGAGESARVSRDGALDGREQERLEPPPDVADFSIRAGESPVVHAPAPPVNIRIQFGDVCAGGGAVELGPERGFSEPTMVSPGDRAGIVRAPRGVRYYRVRCEEGDSLGEVQARGALRVRRNAGTAPLPRRPAHTELEADGRRYTVHYQNLLPRLTFSWSDAPADNLDLYVADSSGRTRRATASGGEHHVRSGGLDEGEYTWWFSAPDNEAIRSPETSLVISFDNAADSAHVREPEVGATWDPSAVRVRGVALEDWRVTAGGRGIDTDAQSRFTGTVSVPADERALAIRFAHPDHGVHYYLRRAGGG